MMRLLPRLFAVTCLAIGTLAARPAEAVPFTLTTDLTGDIRAANPDGLLVHVTVTGDTTSNQTQWTVDLDSSAHVNMNLHGFFFNLANPAGTSLSFSNFSPSAWSIATSTNNAQGSGNAEFEFEAMDPPGGPNNVTNTTSLTFTATLNGGLWDPLFLQNAPLSTGAAIPAPGAQMGAHLRSLSTAGCTRCSDSGFASGSFTPSEQVPEPTTLLLTGLGLLGLGFTRRRR